MNSRAAGRRGMRLRPQSTAIDGNRRQSIAFDRDCIRTVLPRIAVFLFVVCAVILILVSFMTPEPAPGSIRGLTFATASEDETAQRLTDRYLGSWAQLDQALNR